MKTKDEKSIQKKYLNFVSSLQLENIKLDFLKAEVNRKILKKKSTLLAEWSDDIQPIDVRKNKFSMVHILQFNGYIEQKKFVSIEIRYRLDYKIKNKIELDEKSIEIFRTTSVRLHSWPYIREILYSTLIKMGLPPFFLPLSIISGTEE